MGARRSIASSRARRTEGASGSGPDPERLAPRLANTRDAANVAVSADTRGGPASDAPNAERNGAAVVDVEAEEGGMGSRGASGFGAIERTSVGSTNPTRSSRPARAAKPEDDAAPLESISVSWIAIASSTNARRSPSSASKLLRSALPGPSAGARRASSESAAVAAPAAATTRGRHRDHAASERRYPRTRASGTAAAFNTVVRAAARTMLSGWSRKRDARSYSGNASLGAAEDDSSSAESSVPPPKEYDDSTREEAFARSSATVKKKNCTVRTLSFRETVLRKDM